MIKKKGKLVLLLTITILFLLLAINFASGVMVKLPVFRELQVEKVCLYDGNTNGDNIVAKKTIKMEGGKTLEERVVVVVRELQKKFSDIELEIIGYDNVSGKKILVLNLKDKDVSVDNYLNSGSTGSRINLGIMVNSLLQNGREVPNWIEGVRILVNGEEGVETSHVNLSEIFYRTRNDVYLQ